MSYRENLQHNVTAAKEALTFASAATRQAENAWIAGGSRDAYQQARTAEQTALDVLNTAQTALEEDLVANRAIDWALQLSAQAAPRKPGRPAGSRKVSEPGQPYGGVQVLLRLTPDMADWVRAQGGQAFIRRLLEEARSA